jgi:Protein of unknown function (DUF550)
MKINCPHCGGLVTAGARMCEVCLKPQPDGPWFVLESYLRRQQIWSARTFGPGPRTEGIVKHIQKELAEILAKPRDLTEWIDVMQLALDGYWRHGGEPDAIMDYLQAKQNVNFQRTWPAPVDGEPTEHDRSDDARRDAIDAGLRAGVDLTAGGEICGVSAPPGGAQPGWTWNPCNMPAGHRGMHHWNGAPARYCKRVPPIREKDRPAVLGEPCECLEGACMVFGTPCEWCRDGYVRTRSSVSEKFVHTDTPVGRVVCKCP